MLHVAIMALAAAAAVQQPAPSGCSAAANRQFDFWVGEWKVVDSTSGQPAGQSKIEKVYGDCVIRENWTSSGFSGGSLNAYRFADGKWHQMWMDSTGAVRHFIGGLDPNGRMVLTAEQPRPGTGGAVRLVRMTFTSNPDGTVRQYSDSSDDGGVQWQLRYDFLYLRPGRSAPNVRP
jgi:hypothetical protein